VQDGGLIEVKEEVDALGMKLKMRMRIAQRQARLTPTPGGISRVRDNSGKCIVELPANEVTVDLHLRNKRYTTASKWNFD
jgi:hypothetical protein